MRLPASDAAAPVDPVNLLAPAADRPGVARLDAQTAARALVRIDPEFHQGQADLCRAFSIEDVRFVLVVEVPQGRQHRVGSGLAESAQGARTDSFSQLRQRVHVFRVPASRADSLQDLKHPFRADPAEGALSARLVLGEVQEKPRDVHHAGGIVHDHHPPRTHDRAGGGDLLVVDGRASQGGGDALHRWTPHLDRLERPPRDGAAADPVDDLVDGGAHGNLHEPPPF